MADGTEDGSPQPLGSIGRNEATFRLGGGQMPRKPRKRDLTFYLLKPEIGSLVQAVSKPEQAEMHDLTGSLPFEALLFVRRSQQRPP